MGVAAIAVLVLICAIRFQYCRKSDAHSDDQYDTFNLALPRNNFPPPTPTTSNRNFDTFDYPISPSERDMTKHATAAKKHHRQQVRRYDDSSDDSSGSSSGADMGDAMDRLCLQTEQYDDSDESSGSGSGSGSSYSSHSSHTKEVWL